jgi:hypothetical protein
MYDAQCMLLDEVLYVGGGDTQSEYDTMLFVSKIDTMEWTTRNTPAMFYALSTYHSQLVLVGGIESSSRQITNALWTSDTGVEWKRTLPPMPTKRYSSSAVNTVSPECLVVAGGGGDNLVDSDTVEVLVDGAWSTVQPLPLRLSDMKPTIHNGKLYLMGGVSQGTLVYYCDVNSFASQAKAKTEKPNVTSLWESFTVASPRSCSASYGNQLISIGGGKNRFVSRGIMAYSTLTETWTRVGELPVALCDSSCIVVPSTGDLLLVGGRTTSGRNARVYKASLCGEGL